MFHGSAIAWILATAVLLPMMTDLPAADLSASRLAGVRCFWCYYGDDPAIYAFPGLVIAEGLHVTQVPPHAAEHPRIAYLSIGQISRRHWAWPAVKGAAWLGKEDPNWPEARTVDVRATDWQRLVVESMAPDLMRRGFDGLFFDTIDQALVVPGAEAALVDLVTNLRRRFPDAILVANGGAAVADRLAPLVDAFLLEGVVSTWDFATEQARMLAGDDRAWKLKELARLRSTGRPVLVIDYAAPAQRAQVRARLEELRVVPLVTTVGLDELPEAGSPP